jgi:hypothetical protein
MSSHTSYAFYDLLPPEITCLVFGYLLPHQLTGVASSCRQARELTDHYFSKRIPSLKKNCWSVTLRWASGFRVLHPNLQSAIEETVGVLPLMDVSAVVDNDTETLYLSVASAQRNIKRGLGMLALTSVNDADQAALKTELSVDLSPLKLPCWEAELKSRINTVECYTSEGTHQLILLGIEAANEAAMNAGLPLPDFSGVVRECWKNSLYLEMKEVNAYAQRCCDELALSHIEKANEAAMKAELPPPDFSGVMQECWEKKLDREMEEVNAYAQLGFDELALSHIEKANEAAMKAELPPPDFSGVMRECREKKRALVRTIFYKRR